MYRLFLTFFAAILLYSVSFAQDNLPDYQNGKVIVKFKSEVTIPQSINSQINSSNNAQSFGISNLDAVMNELSVQDIKQKFPHHSKPEFQAKVQSELGDISTLENIYQIEFDEKIPVKYAIGNLYKTGKFEYVEPLYIHEAFDVPNDADYSVMQHLPQIMAEEAWDIAKGEEGDPVIVGICDSGVEWDHPDLIDNLLENLGEDADGDGTVIYYDEDTDSWMFDPDDINGVDDDGNGYVDDFLGWNFAAFADGYPENDVNVTTNNRHGTHVAGLSAGVTNNEIGISSISWNVKYMISKHGSNTNSRAIYDAYSGIVYLAENGADIINMSWGGGYYSSYEQELIDYVLGYDVILVAAAGNDNTNNPHFPSSYSGVVSVASVADTDEKAYYSTYGPTVDISAPGGDVYVDGGLLSTIPGFAYDRLQGTSMASPVATGLFALVKSYFPEKTNEEIMKQVLGTTDDIYNQNPGFENMLGTGRINALKALTEEPALSEDISLSAIGQSIYVYDEEFDNYDKKDMLYENSEGILELVLKNNNNFFGADELNIVVSSHSPDLMLGETEFTTDIDPDGILEIGVDYQTAEECASQFVMITIETSSPDANITEGNIIHIPAFINGGGVLVFQPYLPMGFFSDDEYDLSGSYIKQTLEENGYEVFLTSQVLPTFDGFDAVFLSMGSTSSPLYSTYIAKYYEIFGPLYDYAYTKGNMANIYLETTNFLSHHNPYIFSNLGASFDLILFGLSDVEYTPEENAVLGAINGEDMSLADGLYYESTSMNNTYEMDRLIPHPMFGRSALDAEEFGTVMVEANNPFGNNIVTSSVSLSQIDDMTCPNNREMLLKRIMNFFGLELPVEFVIGDVEVCKNSPVELGIDSEPCGETEIQRIVTGGSGDFSVEWNPKFGLDDPYSANPTYLNPYVSRTYQVTVHDNVYNESYYKDINVTVNNGPSVSLPFFVMHSFGNPLNLNDMIYSIDGIGEPYDYLWSNQYGETVDPENPEPGYGINRYYLNVVDANGCVSRTSRIIVYVGWFKQLDKEQIVTGENGTTILAAYPNPVIDEVKVISVFEGSTNANIRVIDLNGNELVNIQKTGVTELEQQINLSNLSAGAYFIVVETDNDTVMKKIIKQ